MYFGKKNNLKGLGPSRKASSKRKFDVEFIAQHNDELQSQVDTLRNVCQEYEQKFDKQEAEVKSLKDLIADQNKKFEEQASRHTKFISVVLSSGSLINLINLTYKDLITYGS